LLAALTVSAWLATQAQSRFRLRNAHPALLWCAVITVFISISGAVASLGDMLFPTASLLEGMQRDFSAASPVLLRLRLIHPVIAFLGASFIIWMALTLLRNSPSAAARQAALRLIALCVFQLFWGAANLTLLAPIWMQLTHLLLADMVWIALVLTVAEAAVIVPEFKAEFLAAMAASSGEPAARNPA
jgi:cytochrome c oxidase assembly protein subunit 15